jgi:L-amino acid N-acyltransferase YncA
VSDGSVAIRPVRPDDAEAIAAIYAPYVRETVITFETEPPDAAEMAERIARLTATHPWLVATRGGAIVGYAYGYPYRARAAYQWVAETGIYVAQGARGGGIGAPLYAALLEALERAGYVAAIGALTVGNAASVALHQRLGFRQVGTQSGIGFKHGAWRDVEFWQKDLALRGTEPIAPNPALDG